MKHFWNGYEDENELSAFWRGQIPLFIEWRKLLIYVFWFKKWEMDNLSPFRQKLIDDFRREIHEGELFSNYTFC